MADTRDAAVGSSSSTSHGFSADATMQHTDRGSECIPKLLVRAAKLESLRLCVFVRDVSRVCLTYHGVQQ